MEFNQIIEHLDQLYDMDRMEEAYQYLIDRIQEAVKEKENLIIVALLSELVSHCRVTAKYEDGNKLSKQLLMMIEAFELKDTLHEATAIMNIATFYRVQGRYLDALALYKRCEQIYSNLLDEQDERYIAFYNNIALLYQELFQYDQAIQYSLKALSLVKDENKRGITYTNLASMYKQKGEEQLGNEALNHALSCFKQANYPDSHYLAAYMLVADNELKNKNYQKAIEDYEMILERIEGIYGKNRDYNTVLERLKETKQKKLSGLALCEEYYYSYGKKMIDEYFKEYKQYMCIGMFGYGSDNLGYDDPISQDHDYGPGFLILLPDLIYDKIGKKLQEKYNELPDTYLGYQRKIYKKGRVGVFKINDFFKQFIDLPVNFLNVEDYDLLCCTNGKIFEDHLGEVTRIRKELSYYPEKIYRIKLAEVLVKVSQTGQYNYYRMKQRDEIASKLCLHEFITYAIHAYYLLNRRYEPYYKWKYKGIEHKEYQEAIGELLENKRIDENIQKLCEMIILKVKSSYLIELDSIFVEDYGNWLMEEKL